MLRGKNVRGENGTENDIGEKLYKSSEKSQLTKYVKFCLCYLSSHMLFHFFFITKYLVEINQNKTCN